MAMENQHAIRQTIDRYRNEIALEVVERQYRQYPELAERYGPAGRAKCLQDANYHLSYLAEALAASQPALFADYVAWAKVLLAGRNIPARDLAANLGFLRDALQQLLPADMGATACRFVDAGLDRLPESPSVVPGSSGIEGPLASLAASYLEALVQGERHRASRMILDAVERGVSIKDIYIDVFQQSQHEIGRLWQTNRLTVAQEHYCTAATQVIMSQLYPYIFSTEKRGRTMVATCVSGDLHEIGLRMVADFFEMEGWDTFYIGANAPEGAIVQMLADRSADLLAISATMTYHLGKVSDLIAAVHSSPSCRGVKIMVGGYPFNVAPDLWQQIGADGCAGDARQAIEVANRLVEGAR